MPLWPIVVSLGEVAQPQALPIACRLNANILRDSNAKERVHTVAQGERFGRGSFGSDRSEAAPFRSPSTASKSSVLSGSS